MDIHDPISALSIGIGNLELQFHDILNIDDDLHIDNIQLTGAVEWGSAC